MEECKGCGKKYAKLLIHLGMKEGCKKEYPDFAALKLQKAQESKRKYNTANRKRINEKQAHYNDEHRDEINRKQAKYNEEHREENRVKQAQYNEVHREEINAKQAVRNSKKSNRF